MTGRACPRREHRHGTRHTLRSTVVAFVATVLGAGAGLPAASGTGTAGTPADAAPPPHVAAKSTPEGYESFLLGNAADAPPVAATLAGGLALLGGGEDVDAAFTWMCGRAGGGDFVVLRTRGSDAYNPYILGLCPRMDSVETIVITSTAGANAPYVRRRIHDAEALFIAGGDQSTYTRLWRGTAVQEEVNHLLNEKGAPVGGTSAGLAALSQFVYTGANGSAMSKKVLRNPFHRDVTIERDLFAAPPLAGILNDSHFGARDRMGRTLVFLARIAANGWSARPRAIGVDEETALLVSPDGAVAMAGRGAAYFLEAPGPAPALRRRAPLTYRGIAVYKAPQGGTFDLRGWSGTGGMAYTLDVEDGVVTSTQVGGGIY